MFESAIFDVVLGLILFFLVLSIICSAVQEWIASAVGLRSRNLRAGIENLIGADIARSLYAHGQFKSLYKQPGFLGSLKKRWGGNGVGPSYVEPKRFANILIDVIDRGGAKAGQARNDAVTKTLAEIEAAIAGIGQPEIREALLSIMAGAQGDIEIFRDDLADWFDDAMDRVSGWYARTVKVWIFVIATVVVVALNADSIHLANTLWVDQALRTALVEVAERSAKNETPPSYADIEAQIELFPIGWKCTKPDKNTLIENVCFVENFFWIPTMVGWLVSIIACSFGAPFWFGLLNKVVTLRGSGKAPVKPGEKPAKA